MKKTLIVLLVAFIALTLFVSCNNGPSASTGYTGATYELGDEGPGGGIVFYDVDADNAKGNADGLTSDECGWRYLEVASKNAEYNYLTNFSFGYDREAGGNNESVETSSEHGGDKLGAGKDNYDKILAAMGKDKAYVSATDDTVSASNYAKYAASVIYYINDSKPDGFGNKTDWFLPSEAEALAMIEAFKAIQTINLGENTTFWTSTEDDNHPTTQAVVVGTGTVISGGFTSKDKSETHFVRPVRRF